MSLLDLIQQIPASYRQMFGLIVILSLIEISPIKLNPWKWIKSFIQLPSKVDELEVKLERGKARQCRRDILRFADTVRRGFQYSKETWDDIKDNIDLYDNYCKKNEDFKNGKTIAAKTFLNKKYNELLETNAFLK